MPTTTTWSRRGTARRPNSPVSRRLMSRFTSPAVNEASKTSAASIETVRKSLRPFGPSATSSLGSTVTSVLAAPYEASTTFWPSTAMQATVSRTRITTSPSAPHSSSAALLS